MNDAVRLDVQSDPRIGVLYIDNPPLNTLKLAMWPSFEDLAGVLHRDQSLRCLVIAGVGDHFSVGADVRDLQQLEVGDFRRWNQVLQRSFHLIATAPQITIAAIRGFALGGGCELALAADFRFAEKGAVLGLPEISLGLIPGSGGTQRLQRLVGPARAKEMILSGRRIDAQEALDTGLIDAIVPGDNALTTALERAGAYANSPYALSLAKRAIELGGHLPIEQGLALEAELVTESFASDDAKIGIDAFLDKTTGGPQFGGR